MTKIIIGILPLLLVSLNVAQTGSIDSAKTNAFQQLAHDILKELVEINTVTATGDTAKAADAMAARLRAVGFDSDDVQVFYPAPHKGNLVARLRGTGKRKPILLLAHLDVVDAKREEWSTDPFQLVEKDGVYYGRGVMDDKAMAAAFVANLIRYRREGYKPDRDLIVVLNTDEETSDPDVVGVQWLIRNHRDLIDAEFALIEDGYIYAKDGKPWINQVMSSEKVTVTFRLEAKNPGGHSSVPSRDNAIYHLADALGRLARFDFPLSLNDTTRAYFAQLAGVEGGQTGADMKAILQTPPDPQAVVRLSAVPLYNAQLRTTCVATMVNAGNAPNALPQLAQATVNCRVMPGEPIEGVQKTLVRVIADDQVVVTQTKPATVSPVSPLTPELLQAMEKLGARFWPGVPLVPAMNVAATDGKFLRSAGIPTYAHTGLVIDMANTNGKHGRDEHLGVKTFFDCEEYLYQLVKTLSGG